jgi:hypothetical protein
LALATRMRHEAVIARPMSTHIGFWREPEGCRLARRKVALFAGVMDDGDLFASSIIAEDIRRSID